MELNLAGEDLIKEFEGCELKAYVCAGGKLTIGYGHTSAAGRPQVTRGMTITRQQADTIFSRDIRRFARQVRKLIKVDLNNNQFSALVSFAYNCGVGALKRSSALKAVNARQFHKVPGRLALWNKSRGKVLKGLVRRRAAEGELFMRDMPQSTAEVDTGDVITPQTGKPMHLSTTNMAAMATGAAGVAGTVKEGAADAVETFSMFGLSTTNMILLAVIAAGVGWIVWERYKKSHMDGI